MMRKVAILSLVLLTSMSIACRKTTGTLPMLQGKWRLVLMTGGFGGIHMTAAQWGHSKYYQFNEKSKYTLTMDGKSTDGGYSLYNDKSKVTGAQSTFIKIGQASYEYNYAHDTLKLIEDVQVDGMTEWYVKEF